MARVADYAIVADSWVVEGHPTDTITFEMPATVDVGSRSILGFMLDVKNQDDLELTLRLNGTKVWTWNYSGSSAHPVRFFQEVIAAGVLKPGTNNFSFQSSSDDFRLVQLSDIVVWWQANI